VPATRDHWSEAGPIGQTEPLFLFLAGPGLNAKICGSDQLK